MHGHVTVSNSTSGLRQNPQFSIIELMHACAKCARLSFLSGHDRKQRTPRKETGYEANNGHSTFAKGKAKPTLLERNHQYSCYVYTACTRFVYSLHRMCHKQDIFSILHRPANKMSSTTKKHQNVSELRVETMMALVMAVGFSKQTEILYTTYISDASYIYRGFLPKKYFPKVIPV